MAITNTQLQDKTTYIHIFARLIQDPFIMNTHKLNLYDFPEKFHQILFGAIHNLVESGAENLSAIAIDGYLRDLPTQHKMFTDGDGIEYIDYCLEHGEPSNFEYNFQRVKKFSLLRRYNNLGLDISDIYNTAYQNFEEEELQNRKFNKATLRDMMQYFETKLIEIKDDFVFDDGDVVEGHASDNIDAIIDNAMAKPNFGMRFPSPTYTTVTRGARRRKLMCVSGPTGSGKTRKGLGDMCSQTIPVIYSKELGTWYYTGNCEKGLFISSELEEDEIKIPAICFIAEVEEDAFHAGDITDEERKRMRIAKRILEHSGLYMTILMDFDVDDIEQLIQKYIVKYDVGYVFFDYIHTTLKMFEYMSNRGAKALAEHQILRILSIQLKNMCNKYNIWIGTATQLNSKWKDDGNVNLDEHALEGGKSTANKFDFGAIQVHLTQKDEEAWEAIKTSVSTEFNMKPTHTINIYKNRGNRWKFIRLWINFNMGTLRVKDMFVTNYQNKLIDADKINIKEILYGDEQNVNLDFIEADATDEDIKEIINQLMDAIEEKNKSSEQEFVEEEFSEVEANSMKQEITQVYAETMEEDPLPDTFEEVIAEFDAPKKSFGDTTSRW